MVLLAVQGTALLPALLTPDRVALPATALRSPVSLLADHAFADFDQDQRPDEAQVSSHGNFKSIRIAFGNAQTSHLHFKSSASNQGQLFTSDLDLDRDADLIWVPQQQLSQAVIWLGNGRGQFELAKSTEAYQSALAQLNAGAAETKLSFGTTTTLSALCSAQFRFSATLHQPFSRPATTLNPLSNNQACLALQQFASHARKRGPPLTAV
ncbi:MAG: hypothetical protein HYR56_05345 [Acidobacteria bacterium]|nr:hypothetical protein [Acidobacteriota bacterium]MBI3424538.1 hypothetical protein [Acidobacteriota bacterium]